MTTAEAPSSIRPLLFDDCGPRSHQSPRGTGTRLNIELSTLLLIAVIAVAAPLISERVFIYTGNILAATVKGRYKRHPHEFVKKVPGWDGIELDRSE